jgi:hypothetical protein
MAQLGPFGSVAFGDDALVRRGAAPRTDVVVDPCQLR